MNYYEAKKYLEQWKGAFELFDKEKPFLQIAGLELLPKKNKTTIEDGIDDDYGFTPLSKMDFAMATGANSTLLIMLVV